MFDPESENFRPRTLRENYLYGNRLQLWNNILVREEMINDLKFKLQRECEKSESCRIELLQKVQEKKEMIQASSGYKDAIVKLNEELSKCIRKNEKMKKCLVIGLNFQNLRFNVLLRIMSQLFKFLKMILQKI